jgi:hypothetical protein
MKLALTVVSALLVAASLIAAGEIPALPDAPPPGIERGAWQVENWGNGGAVEKVTLDNQKLVKLSYKGDKKEKAAFKHPTAMGIDREGKLRLNVYSDDDKPPQLAVAIITTRGFRWHESKPVDLKKGWNKLEFAIGLKEWKTQTSDWKYTVPVEPADDVRAILLLVLNGDKAGALCIQGLSCDPDENGKKAALLIKDLQSDNAELRLKAEKGLVAIGRPATEALHQLPEDAKPEVALRAASVLRQIEMLPEEMPLDPAARAEVEKKLEERRLDEARRRVDNSLRNFDNERIKLGAMLREAQNELAQGRVELEGMKNLDAEKKKAYEDNLTKLETIIKDTETLLKALPVLEPKPKPKPPQANKGESEK